MEILLEEKLEKELKKDYKKFKSLMLDLDEEHSEYLSNDENCWNLFIFSIVYENSNLISCVRKLRKAGVDHKVINNYFYHYIKLKYKMEQGIWSWNEIQQFNIPLEDIKKTSTKMVFF
jgi:hypothetical protein